MPKHDISQVHQLIAGLRSQSVAYRQQLANWLGLGSAGGTVALLTFAAALPDPDYALQVLAPSLTAFIVGLIAAAPNLLLAAIEAEAAEGYFAHAANRDGLTDAIDAKPEIIAAPKELADRLNASRNALIVQYNDYNAKAEKSWSDRLRWRLAIRITTAVAAIGFIVGVGAPLVTILTGTHFVPADALKAKGK